MKLNKRIFVLLLIFVIVGSLTGFVSNTNDKIAIFESIEVKPGEVVYGDCVSIFGSINANGDITGDMVSIFGNISLSGKVDGDVVSIFGTLKANEGSLIKGDTVTIGGNIERAYGSTLEGEVVNLSLPDAFSQVGISHSAGINPWSLVGLAVLYGFCCLAYLLLPNQIKFISKTMWAKMPRRFLIGILTFLAFIPIIIIMAITVVGLLAIPFFILAFALMVFLAFVSLYIAIGAKVIGNLEDKNSVYIYILVGVILVFALKFIPIVGWLGNMVITCIAVGALIDTRFGENKKPIPSVVWEGPIESVKPIDNSKKSEE